MQYADLRSRSDSTKRFDCTSEHEGHPKNCLNRLKEFEINVADFPGGIGAHKRRIKSADDIHDYLEYACGVVPELNEIQHLIRLRICPAPLITPLSFELYRMHQCCGNNRWPYPGSYFDQLEIYIEASAIIASEESALAQKAMKDGKR